MLKSLVIFLISPWILKHLYKCPADISTVSQLSKLSCWSLHWQLTQHRAAIQFLEPTCGSSSFFCVLNCTGCSRKITHKSKASQLCNHVSSHMSAHVQKLIRNPKTEKHRWVRSDWQPTLHTAGHLGMNDSFQAINFTGNYNKMHENQKRNKNTLCLKNHLCDLVINSKITNGTYFKNILHVIPKNFSINCNGRVNVEWYHWIFKILQVM